MDCLKIGACLGVFVLATATTHAAGSDEKSALIQQVEDLRISILQKQKVAGFYSANLKIEAQNQEGADLLHRLMPRVRDSVLIGLSSYLPIIWSRDDEPRHDTVVSLVHDMVASVCPPDTIKNIYLLRSDFSLPRR